MPGKAWQYQWRSKAVWMGEAVMNAMATARGLQLPRNDTGTASGCMTPARQNRSAAACAPARAWMRTSGLNPCVAGGPGPLATVPASTPLPVQCARCRAVSCSCTVCSADAQCREHTARRPRARRRRLPHAPRQGPPRRRKVNQKTLSQPYAPAPTRLARGSARAVRRLTRAAPRRVAA